MSIDTINDLGFVGPAGHSVSGRVSIADLSPRSKKRCGIYLLRFSDGTFYIGQAVDTVRRFAQHRKNYANIDHYWFQSVGRPLLDSVEQRLIREAESAGVLLTNRTFVTNIVGETDLDLLVTPDEQQRWLSQGVKLDNENVDVSQGLAEKHFVKYRQNFQKLQQQPHYCEILELLRVYFRWCLPAYKKTEQSFWSLTCMPSTGKNTWLRYCCLNISNMEALVAGTEKCTGQPFAFVVIAKRLFKGPEKRRILNTYECFTAESTYRTAGADQCQLHFDSITSLTQALIHEPLLRHSIREMNLRLMRRGGTIFPLSLFRTG